MNTSNVLASLNASYCTAAIQRDQLLGLGRHVLADLEHHKCRRLSRAIGYLEARIARSNPFVVMSHDYQKDAVALASCFAALHIRGYASDEVLAQLWAACRAVGIMDRELYGVATYLAGKYFQAFQTDVTYEIDDSKLETLQALACEFLEAQAQ